MPPSSTSGSRTSSSSTRKSKVSVSSSSGPGGKAAEGPIKLKTRSATFAGGTAAATTSSTAIGLSVSSTPSRTARARKSVLSSSALKPPSSHVSSASHGISLSPSAHPRTDPLSALSTLLKLLRSLPGRIGGCAYKLTPAEHALAVHLMGVLDPFVFRGYRASTSSASGSVEGRDTSASPLLLQQPTEILDNVLSHLDSRKDVLNLGLACKRLWEVVSPRHLEYRVVRAKPSNVAVWAHLVRNKHLARNVRRLEVVDERMAVSVGSSASIAASAGAIVRVPRTLLLSRDTDHDSTDDELALHVKYQKYLCAALARMTSLKAFKWGTGKPGAGGVRLSDLWGVLMKANGVVGGLRELVLCDNFVFQPVVADEESSDEAEEESEDSDSSEEEGAVLGALVRGKSKTRLDRVQSTNLPELQTIVFRSTSYAYGTAKLPELARISGILHQCVNLMNLEITYISPRTPLPSGPNAAAGAALNPILTPQRTRPLADDLLSYTRLSHLTHLTLTNLRCTSSEAVASFLGTHEALEVLHFEVAIHGAAGGLELPKGSLPRLREVKASKELINAILECPLPHLEDGNGDGKKVQPRLRPLEVVAGFKLSGSHASSSGSNNHNQSTRNVTDVRFLTNLRFQGSTIKRIEMTGWHDMEDVRRIVGCVPGLVWLDVGRRLGGSSVGLGGAAAGQKCPVAHLTEWTEVLGTLPELVAVHGIRFFYEVSSAAMGLGYDDSEYSTYSTTQAVTANVNGGGSSSAAAAPSQAQSQYQNLSMMERSRMRKNDETAGVLAWKCKKLRRLDHWEGYESANGANGAGKVVVLLREGKEVRWEVRRVRA